MFCCSAGGSIWQNDCRSDEIRHSRACSARHLGSIEPERGRITHQEISGKDWAQHFRSNDNGGRYTGRSNGKVYASRRLSIIYIRPDATSHWTTQSVDNDALHSDCAMRGVLYIKKQISWRVRFIVVKLVWTNFKKSLKMIKGLAMLLLAMWAVSSSAQTIPAVYYKLWYITRDAMNVSRIETVRRRRKRESGA